MTFAVIVDAGSSGSRVHVYSWNDPKDDESTDLAESLPRVESKKEWVHRVQPGISSFAGNETRIWGDHLSGLVRAAEKVVPSSERSETPVYFLATAGLRLLPEAQRKTILDTVCTDLKKRSSFYLPECETHVAQIDGETEGLYGWLALNYLIHSREGKHWTAKEEGNTYGFLDMGGASAQIAFVPNATERAKHINDLHTIKLRTLGGHPVEWNIFVSTWLGFGANQAQKRYRQSLLSGLSDKELEPLEHNAPVPVVDPCLPATAMDEAVELLPAQQKQANVLYYGSGDFQECVHHMEPLLNNDRPCDDDPCLFDGVHVPAFDLAHQKFVGVSEYWYTAQDLYQLDGKFDYSTYVERATKFCDANWSDIMERFKANEFGEMPEQGLMRSCLKSAWVLSILHKGFKFPLSPSDPITHHNFLDTFQSAAHVEGVEVSWTLGRALLYAANQIPPADPNSSFVGFQSYNGEAVTGGEVLQSQSPLLESSSKHRTMLPLFILFLIGAAFLVARILKIPGITSASGRLFGWLRPAQKYEPVLPVTEINKSASASPHLGAIALTDFHVGTSTSTIPSNVPSRVSSRMNMREEW